MLGLLDCIPCQASNKNFIEVVLAFWFSSKGEGRLKRTKKKNWGGKGARRGEGEELGGERNGGRGSGRKWGGRWRRGRSGTPSAGDPVRGPWTTGRGLPSKWTVESCLLPWASYPRPPHYCHSVYPPKVSKPWVCPVPVRHL